MQVGRCGRMNLPMKLLTWNVLHRVHAETHAEPTIVRWPDEALRVRAVASWVAKAVTREGFEVALLQEVSGDVLAMLKSQLHGHAVLNHVYPRVPAQKGHSLRDPSEHLVVVAPQGAKLVRAQTFENDRGKGFLMVVLKSGLTVISTHISWGHKAIPQLLVLGQVLRDVPQSVCLGGDFNAGRDEVLKAIDADVTISSLPEGSPRTRPQDNESGGGDIDHLLCRRGKLVDVSVLDNGELSDHRPVAATLSLG